MEGLIVQEQAKWRATSGLDIGAWFLIRRVWGMWWMVDVDREKG